MNGLVAADVGNSSIKLGWFTSLDAACPTPEREATFTADQIGSPEWISCVTTNESISSTWVTASVNKTTAAKLHQWVTSQQQPCISLTHESLDLETAVVLPERVGIDRLLAAVAVNQLRPPESAAIIVDSGTAITVDAVDVSGVFQGGAILPGIHLSAKFLFDGTDQLPLLEIPKTGLTHPPSIGKDTSKAITSGLYWGTLGAVKELIASQAESLHCKSAAIFVSGGNLPWVDLLGGQVQRHASLVLSGIAIAAKGMFKG